MGLMLRLVVCCLVMHVHGSEPQCSKFPYEEAMLEKIVRLEFSVERSVENIKAMESNVNKALADLQAEKNKFENDRNELREKLKDVVNGTTIKVREVTIETETNLGQLRKEVKDSLKHFEDIIARIFKDVEDLRNKTINDTKGKAGVLDLKDSLGPPCPNSWVYFEGQCYLFARDHKTFTEAEHFCIQRGAHLVHADTELENLFLINMSKDLVSSPHWLGLTDVEIDGVWKWVHNDQVASYIDWHPSQPDKGPKDHCVVIWPGHDFHWGDIGCSYDKARPICQKPVSLSCIEDVRKHG